MADIRRLLREDRIAQRNEYRTISTQISNLASRFEDMVDDVAGFRRELLDHVEGPGHG